MKTRLDTLLVDRGIFSNLTEARAEILAGTIWLGSNRLTKAGEKVAEDVDLTHRSSKPRFVSRAGEKLEFALRSFDISVAHCTCLDVGASNGGFTDCLLKNGASGVFAVDVGYGLLDSTLRADSRVAVVERTNARNLSKSHLENFLIDPTKLNFVSMDVSFISVREIIPAILPIISKPADWVLLFKPQFEVPREDVVKGGLAKPAAAKVAAREFESFCKGLRLELKGKIDSPVPGKKSGNVEILYHYVTS